MSEGMWTTTPTGRVVERPAMVTCRECGETKPRERMSRADKHMGWCKDCRNRYRREFKLRTEGPLKREPRRNAAGDYRCGSCLGHFPLSHYQMRDRGHGPEPKAYCNDCNRKREQQYQAEARAARAAARKGGW